jgi:hypothetical protein
VLSKSVAKQQYSNVLSKSAANQQYNWNKQKQQTNSKSFAIMIAIKFMDLFFSF